LCACGGGDNQEETHACDPDPCTMENAVPGSCQEQTQGGFSCECVYTYQWQEGACVRECVAEGENAPVIVDAPSCCGDLIKVEIASPPQCIPIQGSVVCVAGPDGDCGPGENECNVPEDCQQGNCVAEGDTVENTPGSPQCCLGLIKAEVADPPDCQADPDTQVCIKGVDGECGPGENICNVPEDCS